MGENVQRSARNLPAIPIVVLQHVLLNVPTGEEKNAVQEVFPNVMESQDVVQNILTLSLELEFILSLIMNKNLANHQSFVFKVESNIVSQFKSMFISLLHRIKSFLNLVRAAFWRLPKPNVINSHFVIFFSVNKSF